MSKSKELMAQRENELLAAYQKSPKYTEVQTALGWDKNKMYSTNLRLLTQNRLRRVGTGRYEVVNGADVPTVAPPPAVIKSPTPVTTAPPNPVVAVVWDSEFIATDLMGSISKLQPLLLLHKDIFDEIEKKVMALISAISEEKERRLTPQEFAEWIELKSLKRQAVEARDKRFPNNGEEKRQ